jgi:hypothetical protein
VERFENLRQAAEAGCLRAQFLAGLAYQTGCGVTADHERAAYWYRKAAAGGDSRAIANLGVMSLLAQGPPASDADAYAWVQSAVGLGHEWLRPALGVLERRITTGVADAAGAGILASVSPEEPLFPACTRAECDPSRANWPDSHAQNSLSTIRRSHRTRHAQLGGRAADRGFL